MKIYLVYGIIICTLFALAGNKGYAVSGLMHSAGRTGFFGSGPHHK